MWSKHLTKPGTTAKHIVLSISASKERATTPTRVMLLKDL